MRRVNLVFVAIVVGSVLAGGGAAASFGTELRTVDTITLVQGQLESQVTSMAVVGEELHVSVRLANPTGSPVHLSGTFVRVFADDGTQLAYGAGERTDDGPGTLGARSELTARYIVRLTPSQADRLETAVEAGPVRVRLFHSMSLGDEPFQIIRNDVVSGEVDG